MKYALRLPKLYAYSSFSKQEQNEKETIVLSPVTIISCNVTSDLRSLEFGKNSWSVHVKSFFLHMESR